ncbi:porin [Oxalobacteraceae bacterium CAVE-383]|nr:porin [Oxalobacteraceae bacterium CAVE-383]
MTNYRSIDRFFNGGDSMLDTKSKLMAAAIGAAFALPMAAHAQTNVVVYGKLYPDITHVNVSGALPNNAATSTLSPTGKGTNNTNLTAMDSPNSRLGFRGTEDLGDGLKAIFQLEMGFSSDTGQATDASAPFSRNTFVGLSGNFGTIRLGNMDTVYKDLGDQMNMLGIVSGNFMGTSNILSKPSFTVNGASSFHLRRTNSFYYESPQMAGFTGLFDWSPNEVAGSASSGVISTGVKYENGPVYAALAYESHKDMFGGSNGVAGNGGTAALTSNLTTPGASSKDDALRATFQYRFPDSWKAELDVAQMRYRESGQVGAGKFNEYKHNSWALGIEKLIGAVTLAGSYGQMTAGSCSLTGGVDCNTNGLEAKMFNAGVGYSFSKRTMLFGVYSYMGNNTGVASNWLDGKPTAGADISTFAVGISHSF